MCYAVVMMTEQQIQQVYEDVKDLMSEPCRRVWAASMAAVLGRGGATAVSRATGVARATIWAGSQDIAAIRGSTTPLIEEGRQRRPGGGRKPKGEADLTVLDDLKALVEPGARGDPMSPLRYTNKSTRNLAEALVLRGHKASHEWVAQQLKALGFSLQAAAKTLEGKQHEHRDAQFLYINEEIHSHHAAGNPCISVDTKKKELIGNYKNAGQEYRPKGQPVEVDTHDFMGELGRAAPYGIYDLFAGTGWVSVGQSADTSEFAVATIRRWWIKVGKPLYPQATSLLVTADCGGSNGHQVRLWKKELQQFAQEFSINVRVCHFPPGTSKWNKIEHQLFSRISRNWRGQTLVDYQTIISLISDTTTRTGLTVQCELDETIYQKGRKVSDKEFAGLNIQRDVFQGDWNYTMLPSAAILPRE